MPPEGSDNGSGQARFTDKEMGFKSPVSAKDEIEPTELVSDTLKTASPSESPEEEGAFDYTDSKSSFQTAENSVFKDPFPKHGEQARPISLVSLLEREFKGSWHELTKTPQGRDKIEGIAHIIMSRFSDPKSVRSFASDFKDFYVDEVKEEIDELDAKLKILNVRFDKAADYERISIHHKAEYLDRKMSFRKITGNEISAYLSALADDWERKLAREH